MGDYVIVDTPGGTIWAEVDDIGEDELPQLARKDQTANSFQQTAQAQKRNAQFLVDLLADLSPDEVEVSFGIKTGVEAGIPFFALAKANAEASYTVKLTWKKDSEKPKQPTVVPSS